MKKFTKVRLCIYGVVSLLIVVLLIGLAAKDNIVHRSVRLQDDIQVISGDAPIRIQRDDAPLGMAEQYAFTLQEIKQDTELIFYSYHSFVEVEIGEELVYSIDISPEISTVETTGGTWSVIPILREDSGKECTVTLIPIYEGFFDQAPEFMLSSLHTVFVSMLEENIVELLITMFVMTIGIVLICFGAIFSLKTKEMLNILSLGVFALSISLWRFSDIPFTTLLSDGNNIYIYYISLTMLMITMIPLLESVKQSFSGKITRAFDVLSFVIALLCIVQLVLQLTGVIDLREMLTLTHVTIVASLVLILLSLIMQLIRPAGKRSFNPAFLVILGIGTDLLLFYVNNSSARLMCTLITILIYVIIECVFFVSKFFDQQKRLADSEITIAHNEAALSESRFTTMMSQIRSHFIFNVLNAISGMCKYDPEKADRTIVHFARFLRSNIDIMQNNDLVHFHNALHHIEDYIALEQVRYGDKIQFETDITVDNFMLPPLVMQPVIENSIKHGLVGKPMGGTVTLRTRKDEDNIYIIIEDDGVGYDSSMEKSEKSIGLQNIRFRLDHMVKGSLETESAVNKGTKTTITIPRKEAEKCG